MERTSSRAGLPPLRISAFSRRTSLSELLFGVLLSELFGVLEPGQGSGAGESLSERLGAYQRLRKPVAMPKTNATQFCNAQTSLNRAAVVSYTTARLGNQVSIGKALRWPMFHDAGFVRPESTVLTLLILRATILRVT